VAADCAMACSGSVSLELLYHTKPTVILYHVSRAGDGCAVVLPQGSLYYARQFARDRRSVFPSGVAVYDPNNPIDAKVLMPEYLDVRG